MICYSVTHLQSYTNTTIPGNSALILRKLHNGSYFVFHRDDVAASRADVGTLNGGVFECFMFYNVLRVFHDVLLVVHDVLHVFHDVLQVSHDV